jgi:Glycosyl hydrolase family 62
MPKAPAGKTWVAPKDFTDVVTNNIHVVYRSTHDSGTSYGSAMPTFSDWPDAAAATQNGTPHGVAPILASGAWSPAGPDPTAASGEP